MNERLAVVLAVGLLVVACSGDDGPTSHGGTDLTPPSVESVTPMDINHVQVTFSEDVSKASAQNPDNYQLIATGYSSMALGVPGDTMLVTPVLHPNGRNVFLTVRPAMYRLTMSLTVYGVSDTQGNRIDSPQQNSFVSLDMFDATPPEVFAQSPAPDATNAAIGQPVVIEFSEPLSDAPFRSEVLWESGSGPVEYRVAVHGATYTLTPYFLLKYDEKQTISLHGVRDLNGNIMADLSWSFRTTRVVDNTLPVVVSTSPPDQGVNVDPDANISITFSEPINQYAFDVDLDPRPQGDVTWSGDGRTYTLDPASPLDADRQYTLTIYPSGVRDLSGNTVAGVTTVVFSTGTSLESGRIDGVVDGHPGTAAADPTGAIVVAAWYQPLAYTPVAGNNSYHFMHLADGPYAILAFKDTNMDGNPRGDGDAIGAYGADPGAGDLDFDTVEILGGAHLGNIDFPLFDPSAITGTVTYEGDYDGSIIFVGVFEKTGFDPSTSQPVAVTDADSPYEGKYALNSVDDRIADGDYYVGSYIDVNNNGVFDRAVEPAGMYGGVTPTAVHMSKGSDAFGIGITISDPVAAGLTGAIEWRAPARDRKFERLRERAGALDRVVP